MLALETGERRAKSASYPCSSAFQSQREVKMNTHVDSDELEHPVLGQNRNNRLLARLIISVHERQAASMGANEGCAGVGEGLIWMN